MNRCCSQNMNRCRQTSRCMVCSPSPSCNQRRQKCCRPNPCRQVCCCQPPTPAPPVCQTPVYPNCPYPVLDTSGTCDTYTCQTAPAGQIGVATGAFDKYGNPIYQFVSNTCVINPTCPDGSVPTISGFDQTTGCPIYSLCPVVCEPAPTCSDGSTPNQNGTDSNNCPTYAACPVVPSEVCTQAPVCPAGQYFTQSGPDTNGCYAYSNCRPCPTPLVCSDGSTQTPDGGVDANGCPTFAACAVTPTCPTAPVCQTGQYYTTGAADSSGCVTYSACLPCPTPIVCGDGSVQQPDGGVDANGCPTFAACAVTPICPTAPTCSDGSTPSTTGTDSTGCPTYAACPPSGGTGVTTLQNTCPTCTAVPTGDCVNCLDPSATSEPITNPNITATQVLSYADGVNANNAQLCGNNFDAIPAGGTAVFQTMYNSGQGCPAGYDSSACASPTTVSTTCQCCPAMAQQTLELVNSLRAAYGLAALTWDPVLASYAQRKACDMSTKNAPTSSGGAGMVAANGCLIITECPGQYAAMQHTDANGETTADWMEADGLNIAQPAPTVNTYDSWGENIAYISNGYQTPCMLMQQWSSDCGHLGNMLGDYNVVGMAICNNGTNSFSAQEFGLTP